MRNGMSGPDVRLRNRCAIVGAGNSALGRLPEMDALALLEQAAWRAVNDAGLSMADIARVSAGARDVRRDTRQHDDPAIRSPLMLTQHES
jgi:hypothetical protein